jgi:predicted RNA-binding protein YlxR (DUF448 family)
MDDRILRRIDADPETRRSGRSAFIRSAIQLYLQAKERRAIDDAITRAYQGCADDLRAEVEDLMKAQAWSRK